MFSRTAAQIPGATTTPSNETVGQMPLPSVTMAAGELKLGPFVWYIWAAIGGGALCLLLCFITVCIVVRRRRRRYESDSISDRYTGSGAEMTSPPVPFTRMNSSASMVSATSANDDTTFGAVAPSGGGHASFDHASSLPSLGNYQSPAGSDANVYTAPDTHSAPTSWAASTGAPSATRSQYGGVPTALDPSGRLEEDTPDAYQALPGEAAVALFGTGANQQ